ncbi:MAG: hypothetical protein IPO44_00650 [Candidatus Microthrix sp.]|nr:hypothetical protein [Candidatus Microthrix sp.]MBK9558128.1 hypothetical protein [Candidatus Microthrix sp.]
MILTSATIPATMGKVLGMPDEATEVLDVGSPFDYEQPGAAVLRNVAARRANRAIPRRCATSSTG